MRDPRWTSETFAGLDPFEALDELKAQGQLSCEDGNCTLPHPLMLSMLQRHLPAPAGTLEGQFYSCPKCMADQVDQSAWDADAFAAEYQERVIEPAERAAQLLHASPYLTRLLTFISPEEMTADPAFHERADLPTHSNAHWAERIERCGEPSRLELPDGRVLLETGLTAGTRFSTMPSAERIEQVGEAGAPLTIVDNEGEIDRLLERGNDGVSDKEATAESRTRRRASMFACSVSSPAWQQTWLWILALYWVRRRARLT